NAYVGDCGGAIALVRGKDLRTAPGTGAPSTTCITADQDAGDVLRVGVALSALGPAPGTTAPRLAIGAPADPLRTQPQAGAVFVAVFTADATTCTLTQAPIRIDGPFAGAEFGSTFGR